MQQQLIVLIGVKVMIGDVIFVRTHSPISWIIRKLTNSKWSHVAIVLSEHYLIETDFLKPVRVRRNKYSQTAVAHLNISDKERLELVSFLLEQTSRGYDYYRIAGILAYILGFTKNKNLWNDYNKDICCELVDRGLTYLNSDNIPKEILNAITPADVANVLLKNKEINT
jgi:hypothetical protein